MDGCLLCACDGAFLKIPVPLVGQTAKVVLLCLSSFGFYVDTEAYLRREMSVFQ